MSVIVTLAAASVAWVAGSLWYMTFARAWLRVSGVELDAQGQPANRSMAPLLVSGLCLIVVAAMMRYLFGLAGIGGIGRGALTGAAIGLMIGAPWLVLTNSYVRRPALLSLIDGGYAVFACGLIGMILGAL
ncbi:MAG: DUF1761 domain-containing protein [Paracoccus sp. (in: a-proteobacteria)]|nr:DUF1761 domain-containing protein [Paracoccus sp. (in: a-proteobacteria)]